MKTKDDKAKSQKQKIQPKFILPNKKRFEIINLNHGTKKWNDWRYKGIDSNDAISIKLAGEWTKKLLHSKRDKDNIEHSQELDLNPDLIQEAREQYEEKSGIKVFPLFIQDRRFSWLQASIDGFSEDFSKIVKINCTDKAYKNAEKNIFPKTQLQHLLMITGLEEIDYWCYLQNKKGILMTVSRDQRFISKLYKAEKEFAEKIDIKESDDNLNKQFHDILKSAGVKLYLNGDNGKDDDKK